MNEAKEIIMELKSKRVTYILFYDEYKILNIEKIRHEKLGDTVETLNPFKIGVGKFVDTLKYLSRKFNKPELMKLPLYK